MNTDREEPSGESALKRVVEQPQYTLAKILGIWLAVTAPMGLIRYVVVPLALPRLPETLHPGIFYWIMMVLGMARPSSGSRRGSEPPNTPRSGAS